MIEVQDVGKTFGASRWGGGAPVVAVDGVGFCCQPGRVFALLGPNGSGKTTVLRMIAALLRPSAGRVRVAGFDTVTAGREVQRRLGFLTGAAQAHSRLTPWELMDYFGGLHGMERAQLARRRGELFERLEIGPYARRPLAGLSAGMRQRVAVVRALLHDPEVVVLDEPTAGLDVVAAGKLLGMVRECRAAGRTVVFSTHIMGEVSMLADDVAIIHGGKLVYAGTLAEFDRQRVAGTLEEEFVRVLEGGRS